MEDFVITSLIIFAIFTSGILYALGYEDGYNQGKCEGQYSSGAIYEQGRCFNPIK